MRLQPIVVLVRPDDMEVLAPSIEAGVAWVNEKADMVADLLATRGWTPEMIVWSSIVHALADGIRRGDLDLTNLFPERSDP